MEKIKVRIILGLVLLLILIGTVVSSGRAEQIGFISIDRSGRFMIAEEIFTHIIHFGEDWTSTGQGEGTVTAHPGYPRIEENSWLLKGEFQAAGTPTPFSFIQSIRLNGEKAFKYEASMTAREDTETLAMWLELVLPIESFGGRNIIFDDAELLLPAEYREMRLFVAQNVQSVTIPLSAGKTLKITGPIDVYVRDGRAFEAKHYNLRFAFASDNGTTIRKGETRHIFLRLEMTIPEITEEG